MLNACFIVSILNTCRCGSRCHFFNDCCQDVPPQSVVTNTPKFSSRSWTCHQLYPGSEDTGMMVINSCPENAPEETASLCEQGDVGEWGLFSWLVTDTDTLLT